MRPFVEDGLGMAAYVYDTADRPFRLRSFIVDGCPIDGAGLAMLQDGAHDDFVRRSWIGRAAMTASETPGYATHPGVIEVFHPAGIRDVMVVNALDAIGVGCWIGAPLRALRRLQGAERERWNRIAAHVRAGLRMRLRLSGAAASAAAALACPPEAVFTTDGDPVHVEEPAMQARGALRTAVLRMERARGELRDDPDRALPSWTALVRARWTLVDSFEADRRQYIVARANPIGARPLARLSERERQVVACLSMGHTNKETAYELGLSHSTVRVLVARARAKLGVTTLPELVAIYRRDTLT